MKSIKEQREIVNNHSELLDWAERAVVILLEVKWILLNAESASYVDQIDESELDKLLKELPR